MTTMRTEGIRGDRRPRRDFFHPRRYGREIAIVLIVKLVALIAIWQLFFAAPRPHVDGPAIGARIYSSDGTPASGPAR